jgi:hypothetical protein
VLRRRTAALALLALAAGGAGGAQGGPAASIRPVVWVQAGHQGPREPGYLAQTGAPGEMAFTTRLAAALERRLRAAGVDARHTPGRVTPMGAAGAVFISLHYDTSSGHAGVAGAVTGGGENWYHGEGTGTASQRPYPDSAPHRTPPTTVSPAVAAASARLAGLIDARYGAAFTPANGARSGPVTLVGVGGNTRMTHYYGFYRTGARARVIVECGAGGRDGAILGRTDLIAGALATAILEDLGLHA